MRHKTFITVNTQHDPCVYERISGWRNREDFCDPSPRHPLYEYRTDEYGRKSWEGNFDPSNGTYVDMDGNLYDPLYIEISPNGDAVRFYVKVR